MRETLAVLSICRLWLRRNLAGWLHFYAQNGSVGAFINQTVLNVSG
jgi:hypothetical protein